MARSVLIVDDSRTILASTRTLFAGAGWEVYTDLSAMGARAQARFRPDVVLLDLSVGGPELADAIREAAPNEPKIVLFSAAIAEDMREAVLVSRCDWYIRKGSGADLVATATAVFEGRLGLHR